MNLVCVAPWCGGTLITDLLNKEQSPFEGSILQSRYNNILKLSTGDEWDSMITNLSNSKSLKGKYFSTHISVSMVPDINVFDKIIQVTTVTTKSQWYRFLRLYYLSINLQKSLQKSQIEDVIGIAMICKNIPYSPFDAVNVENLELEDVIEGRFVESINGNKDHFNRWIKRNKFLFDEQDPETVKIWEEQQVW